MNNRKELTKILSDFNEDILRFCGGCRLKKSTTTVIKAYVKRIIDSFKTAEQREKEALEKRKELPVNLDSITDINAVDNETDKLLQLTEWGEPYSKITTGKGTIGYYTWLVGEGKRITSDPSRYAEIRSRTYQKLDDDGNKEETVTELALFVDKVA